MRALPLVLALAVAAACAPALLQALRDAGQTRSNYRGRQLPCPFGVLVLAGALLALIPLTLIDRLASTRVFEPHLLPAAAYAVGVLALGLVDDALGRERTGARRPAPRGWRGHGAAVVRGELSTGALKAGGSLGLALLAMSFLGRSDWRWLLATAVLVLATHALNLLDLRPGRSAKALLLLGAGLTVGTREVRVLWTLGLFVGPALVTAAYDMRERALLGDAGASLLGALAGLWLVLSLSGTGQIVALALLLALAVYGELRSISALIERIPLLRKLDSWGRPS